MTEPIVHYGIYATCGDGQGMLIEQHERIVAQLWPALVAEIADLKCKNAEQYQEIERRKRGLQRVMGRHQNLMPGEGIGDHCGEPSRTEGIGGEMSEIQRCELMRANGGEHCAHIELGQPCCQCGYIRPVNHLAEVQRLREQVRLLRDSALNAADALARAYAGMIQDADVQNLVGIRAAIAQTAPGEQR